MRSAVVALVPVKALDKAKSRLGTHLSSVERSALARHMIYDVLSVLSAVPRLVTMVVTSDAVAKQIAAQFDLTTITDQGSDESVVVEHATRHLVAQRAAGSLVIPGDVPLLTAEEVEQVLADGMGNRCVLVPSRSGRGTNAVLRMPPDLIDLKFGNDSFIPHLEKARRAQVHWKVLRLSGLGLDIDELDDLYELLRRPAATHTHAFLADSGIADRLSVHEPV